MATVATLPFAKVPKGYNKDLKVRSSTKSKPPLRSMTHPVHDHPKNTKTRRVKNGEAFDPEELTLRLTAYVADQKLASQIRRDTRAAKERAAAIAAGLAPASPTDAVYHHIPTVAAAAFQRTATPNLVTVDTVHKLAAPVLKAALSPNNPDETFLAHNHSNLPARQASQKRPTTGLQRNLLQDQVAVEKERVRNRNQFQRTRSIEEAAEMDELRDVYRVPVRTFGEFAHLRNASGKGHSRPLSMGDLFSDSEDTDTIPSTTKVKVKTKAPVMYDGRNDWAQKEEEKSPVEKGKGTVKERVSGQILRRKESVWVLMGKKERVVGGSAGSGKEGSGVEECTSPPPMDGKKSFLARFKRHPS